MQLDVLWRKLLAKCKLHAKSIWDDCVYIDTFLIRPLLSICLLTYIRYQSINYMKFNTNKRHVVERRSRKNRKSRVCMDSKSSFFLHRIQKINMTAKFCSNGYMDLHSYDTYCNLIKQSTQPCFRLLAGHQFYQQTIL